MKSGMSWAGRCPRPRPWLAYKTFRVNSDLFAVVSGIAPDVVAAAVPPVCRRAVDTTCAIAVDGDAAIVELPEWTFRQATRHLVPAFSPLTDTACTFRFELSASIAGAWTPWTVTASVGPQPFDDGLAACDAVTADVDLYRIAAGGDRARLRLRVRPAGVLDTPWLATLSACDLERVSMDSGLPDYQRAGRSSRRAVQLQVPGHSQMEEPAALRERICSPTSVAMVLGYWQRRADVGALAAEVYHRGLDIYGVWPAAIRAGARRGIPGYLLRFPDWDAAAWCLGQGLPVIASVRYEAGELTGAAVPRTSGHLLVLTGLDGDHVLVNDPAAPTRDTVPRRYLLDELTRIWLDRSGVGYVFFRDGGP